MNCIWRQECPHSYAEDHRFKGIRVGQIAKFVIHLFNDAIMGGFCGVAELLCLERANPRISGMLPPIHVPLCKKMAAEAIGCLKLQE